MRNLANGQVMVIGSELIIAKMFGHVGLAQILGGQFSSVFYDVSSLCFEASYEDDLKQLGYSKDGKHQQPQILIGLLVGKDGLPLAFEIFGGNRFEGHTLIPVLESFTKKLGGQRPIVLADAGLLSKQNMEALQRAGYGFIQRARLKSEPERIRT